MNPHKYESVFKFFILPSAIYFIETSGINITYCRNQTKLLGINMAIRDAFHSGYRLLSSKYVGLQVVLQVLIHTPPVSFTSESSLREIYLIRLRISYYL